MNINRKLLSFRYRKKSFLNRSKRKKLEITPNKIDKGSHTYCPICSSDEVYLISEVDRVGFPCDTVMCKKCEFVFNNSYISNPNEFYANQFGKARWGNPEKNFIKRTAKDSFSKQRFAFLIETLGENLSNIERILEIGCGDGCNLLPYHLMGKSVTGCDFNTRFLEPGLKRGLNLIKGDVNSIPDKSNFDLIMLIHSFEHVINLDATVQSASNRLIAGGLVFVEVPGIIGLNQIREKSNQDKGLKTSNNFLAYLQFEHNYHFTLEHLKLIWERNGFEMTYGDEWVRAIFRKKHTAELSNNESSFNKYSSNTMNHLINVEKDYLKISNLLSGIGRLFIRKISSNN